MADAMRAIWCRIVGHKWEWQGEMRYRQELTFANEVEPCGDAILVPVTWVCDEVCARCGGETWWPV